MFRHGGVLCSVGIELFYIVSLTIVCMSVLTQGFVLPVFVGLFWSAAVEWLLLLFVLLVALFAGCHSLTYSMFGDVSIILSRSFHCCWSRMVAALSVRW
jgi:hypothetical protein